MFSVSLPDINTEIQYSALSLLTQFTLIVVVLFIKPTSMTVLNPGSLATATLRLKAIDEPDEHSLGSYSYLDPYIAMIFK